MDYENHKLCPDLKAKEICLVVEMRDKLDLIRTYHEHIPAHRISEEALGYLLCALVLKFDNNEARTITRAFLNKRGSEPSVHRFMWNSTYPEPGVIRKYCGIDTHAWVDRVIIPGQFRPS